MLGRLVRLIAATAVLTLGGLSAASAGGFGYGGYGNVYGYGYGKGYYGFGGSGYGNGCCGPTSTVADWGCGTSCAPLPSFYYATPNCCAPVRWGCGNPCGYGAYVTGDWGLYRPGAVTPQVYGPILLPREYYVPGYFPSMGRRPRYGRREITIRRPPRPGPSYHREWISDSGFGPVTEYPPFDPPSVTLEPRGRHSPGRH